MKEMGSSAEEEVKVVCLLQKFSVQTLELCHVPHKVGGGGGGEKRSKMLKCTK